MENKARDLTRLRKKILIVEDEESLRSLYSAELGDEGYDCLPARNGKEAIRVLREVKPDLIILDIVMPLMDGMEALGRIISQYRDIPIILYSSYAGYKEDFMSWSADAYLIKSSDLTELKATIRGLLSPAPGGALPFEKGRSGGIS